MASISQLLNDTTERLSKLYSEREASSITRTLFKDILAYSGTELALFKMRDLMPEDEKKLKAAIKRLLKGEPIQYIIGHTEFLGFRFKVNEHVLIPRQETEELVQWIHQDNKLNNKAILDLCTGSGCIAISLERLSLQAHVSAVDISPEALHVAKENAEHLGASIKFIQTDILSDEADAKLGSYDIIVSNPPYVLEQEKEFMHINVLNHEPSLALFVPDHEPLLFYRIISKLAMEHLKPLGKLYFEINEKYGNEVKQLLEVIGFKNIIIKQDMHGKDRFVKAEK
jgi:release factor glutamine methyltransferase